MIAKLAPTFRRFIDHAKNITLLGAIAAGCVYGYAFAIAPTVDSNREFVGGVNIAVIVGNSDTTPVYTVPAGRLYTLTDVIATNPNGLSHNVFVYIADTSDCSDPVLRMNAVTVPAQSTVHVPLVTGFGFGPGKTVCLVNGAETLWTLRGYLSNDA